MSQRDSGYERKERDCYETPEWVTRALLPHFPREPDRIWEPACASGKMVAVLSDIAFTMGTDITDGVDFLTCDEPRLVYDAVITNPPYKLATEFIGHALALMQPSSGFVAMLLRTDFDHAKTRQHLFSCCPMFAKKLVLTKRIRWFEDSTGSPSFNHAWFVWDWKHEGPPTLAYH
jgi:hypothetical protein